MRGRDYEWHRELLTDKQELKTLPAMPVTKRERRRAYQRNERAYCWATILIAFVLLYLARNV